MNIEKIKSPRAQKIIKVLSKSEWRSRQDISEALEQKRLYDGDIVALNLLEEFEIIEKRKGASNFVTSYKYEYRLKE